MQGVDQFYKNQIELVDDEKKVNTRTFIDLDPTTGLFD